MKRDDIINACYRLQKESQGIESAEERVAWVIVQRLKEMSHAIDHMRKYQAIMNNDNDMAASQARFQINVAREAFEKQMESFPVMWWMWTCDHLELDEIKTIPYIWNELEKRWTQR